MPRARLGDIPPNFYGSLAANLPITANVDFPLTTLEDSHKGWGGSSYTIKRAGIYSFRVRVGTNASGATLGDMAIYKSGTFVQYVNSQVAAGFESMIGWAEIRCAVGEVYSWRSTRTFTTGGAAGVSYMAIDWLRP